MDFQHRCIFTSKEYYSLNDVNSFVNKISKYLLEPFGEHTINISIYNNESEASYEYKEFQDYWSPYNNLSNFGLFFYSSSTAINNISIFFRSDYNFIEKCIENTGSVFVRTNNKIKGEKISIEITNILNETYESPPNTVNQESNFQFEELYKNPLPIISRTHPDELNENRKSERNGWMVAAIVSIVCAIIGPIITYLLMK